MQVPVWVWFPANHMQAPAYSVNGDGRNVHLNVVCMAKLEHRQRKDTGIQRTEHSTLLVNQSTEVVEDF